MPCELSEVLLITVAQREGLYTLSLGCGHEMICETGAVSSPYRGQFILCLKCAASAPVFTLPALKKAA